MAEVDIGIVRGLKGERQRMGGGVSKGGSNFDGESATVFCMRGN